MATTGHADPCHPRLVPAPRCAEFCPVPRCVEFCPVAFQPVAPTGQPIAPTRQPVDRTRDAS